MNVAGSNFERRVRTLAYTIAAQIRDLPTTWSPQDVVAIWRARKESSQMLGYAYKYLDRKSYRLPEYLEWHPRLRSTRNHPEHGPQMFAAIRKEES